MMDESKIILNNLQVLEEFIIEAATFSDMVDMIEELFCIRERSKALFSLLQREMLKEFEKVQEK